MALRMIPLRIIGCGNFNRGDDAAGLLVARRLRELGGEIPEGEIIERSGESFSLMDCWTGFQHVILVDATAPRGTPGKVRIWNAHADRLPEDAFPCSTHAFGLREAVELGRVMNCLPQTVLIYGIEGKQFACGAPISLEVEHSVESVAQQLQKLVRTTTGPAQTARSRA